MLQSITKKTGLPSALLIGTVLTLLALVAHRFLPERRLSLDGAREGAHYFLMQLGEGTPAWVDWVNQGRLHYRCQFARESVTPDCSFVYLLHSGQEDRGIDLSRFRTLNLTIHYTGAAQYVRVAIRNFDPRFSNISDANSSKFNSINLQPKDLAQPLSVDLGEFAVPEWWVSQYNLSRELAQPDLGNATALTIDLLGDLPGTDHQIRIEKIEFVGDWISAESWYLGLLSLWMVLATTYGLSQWVLLRRKHHEQSQKIDELQTEKEKFEKLSTLDGLTKVLNRHGIERFVESLRHSNLPTSVIVIDLDNFKQVNDLRGHHVGDRVLQTVGEILRTHTRNTDGLGRWGGEEFVLVCPGASLGRAADLAEKLRHRILQTNFIPEEPLALTASFGVATSQDGAGFEDAFRQADEALYLAKNRGRNCVVAAADEQMHKVTGARKGTWALISGRFKLHK